MQVAMLRDYFDPRFSASRLDDDIAATRPIPQQLRTNLSTNYAYDAEAARQQEGLVRGYFAASSCWLTLCLFASVPLAVLVVVARAPACRLIALATIGVAASQIIFPHIASFNYLHLLATLFLLLVGTAISRGSREMSNAAPDQLYK